MKKRAFCIGLSLMIPGLGQLVAKMWLRGALELLAALACVLWAAAEVVVPIALMISDLLNSNGRDVPRSLNLWHVGVALGLVILLYVWSVFELSTAKGLDDAPPAPPEAAPKA